MQRKTNNVHTASSSSFSSTSTPSSSSNSICRQVRVKWKQCTNAAQTIRAAAEYVSACGCVVRRVQPPCSKAQVLSAGPASLALTGRQAGRQAHASPAPSQLAAPLQPPAPADSHEGGGVWGVERRKFFHHKFEAKSSASLPARVGYFNRGEG